MTKSQLILIHTAKRQLGLTDDAYRTVLRSVAHVESSKDLTNKTFEQVMAVMEAQGFRTTGRPDDYWQGKAGGVASGQLPVASCDVRQVHLIRTLHAATPGYKLPGLVRRFSHDRTDQEDQLNAREAAQLIEMLKAVGKRTDKVTRRQGDQVTAEGSAVTLSPGHPVTVSSAPPEECTWFQ